MDSNQQPAQLSPAAMGGGSVAARNWRSLRSNLWVAYLARRLFGALIVLVVLVVMVFLMVRLIPGNPAEKHLGFSATPKAVAELNRSLGLDNSLLTQFWDYIKNLVHGNLGYSFQFSAAGGASGTSVQTVIGQRIGSSLQLTGAALGLVVIFAVPLGMAAGTLTRDGRHRRLELLFTGTTSVLAAIPDYLSGTILAFIFAVEFRVLPVSGSGLDGLILPAIAVAIAPTAYVARIARVETLNVLAQDYMRTARSKRLSRHVIMFRHALPNIITSALTLSGLIFSALIGGTILVEAVFNRPGLGSELVQAVVDTDYPTVQGVVLVLGSLVVVVNLLVDIVLAVLDPRNLTRHT